MISGRGTGDNGTLGVLPFKPHGHTSRGRIRTSITRVRGEVTVVFTTGQTRQSSPGRQKERLGARFVLVVLASRLRLSPSSYDAQQGSRPCVSSLDEVSPLFQRPAKLAYFYLLFHPTASIAGGRSSSWTWCNISWSGSGVPFPQLTTSSFAPALDSPQRSSSSGSALESGMCTKPWRGRRMIGCTLPSSGPTTTPDSRGALKSSAVRCLLDLNAHRPNISKERTPLFTKCCAAPVSRQLDP